MSEFQQPAVVTISGHGPAAGAVSPVMVSPPQNMRYKADAGKKLGIVHVVFGIISLLCGIVTTATITLALFTPLWAGILYIVAGSLGIAAARRGSCQINGYMAMSIISALVAPVQISLQFIGALAGIGIGFFGGYIHLVAALIGVGEFIVAIISSVFCCQGTCCGGGAVDTELQIANQSPTNPY